MGDPVYYGPKRIDDMTREELIAALKDLAIKYHDTLDAHMHELDVLSELRRARNRA